MKRPRYNYENMRETARIEREKHGEAVPHFEVDIRQTRFGWEARITKAWDAEPGELPPMGLSGPVYWRPTFRWIMARAARTVRLEKARSERNQQAQTFRF